MKTKTFWTILIKILGLSILFSSLTVVPQFFSTLYATFQGGNDSYIEISFFLIFSLLIYLLILRLFVFKPEWIIKNLKLEKNIEENIDLDVKASTILNISIAVIGGLMLAGSIPMLCETLFEFFRQSDLFIDFENSKWIVAYFLKSLIGYLLFTNSKAVTKLIFKQADETD
ncbi:hypothetical protein [Flavobacterium sp.]|uniref:hypothetical protein n=1 Tax=Flavobacterium sp. TaxID=239 RepID=UPI002B4B8F7A|nr:hypothetical protein [Flavobacterium sp.]HLF50950.1 hypothetical protein [Flavobacterium sp.]